MINMKKFLMMQKNKVYETIDSFEEQKKYKIDLDWLNDLALTTQVVIKKVQLIISMAGYFIQNYLII